MQRRFLPHRPLTGYDATSTTIPDFTKSSNAFVSRTRKRGLKVPGLFSLHSIHVIATGIARSLRGPSPSTFQIVRQNIVAKRTHSIPFKFLLRVCVHREVLQAVSNCRQCPLVTVHPSILSHTHERTFHPASFSPTSGASSLCG